MPPVIVASWAANPASRLAFVHVSLTHPPQGCYPKKGTPLANSILCTSFVSFQLGMWNLEPGNTRTPFCMRSPMSTGKYSNGLYKHWHRPKYKTLRLRTLSPDSQPLIMFSLGSIPHPVMGTTRYYCRYIKVLLTPY